MNVEKKKQKTERNKGRLNNNNNEWKIPGSLLGARELIQHECRSNSCSNGCVWITT